MTIKPIVLDLETSLGKGSVHGPDAKNPDNDFYTTIHGTHPDNIHVLHNEDGFNRHLSAITHIDLAASNILVGHNLSFDLSYIWKEEEVQKWLSHDKEIWDCFTGNTEILTESGWQRFDTLNKADKVAQYHLDGSVSFVYPDKYICKDYEGDLLHLKKDRFINHLSTPGHNRVVRTYRFNKLRLEPANSKTSLFTHHKAILSGKHDGDGLLFSDDELRLIVAIQADGHVTKQGHVQFEFTKRRKIDRLKEIIKKINLEFVEYAPKRSFRLCVKNVTHLTEQVKIFGNIKPYDMSLKQKNIFIDELVHWDGHSNSKNCFEYYSYRPASLDKVQEICALSGRRTHRVDKRLSITKTDFTTQNTMKQEKLPYKGKVYCVSVPSNMILIRHDGCVQVTGNCQLAEYYLTGQRHRFASLAELQEIYLGEKVKESRISRLFAAGVSPQDIIKAQHTHKRVWALYEKYCYSDGATALKIFAAQYRRAKEKNMLNIIKVHQKGLLAVIMMQNAGVHIDIDNCERTARDFRLKSMDYLAEASKLVEPYWNPLLGKFNINSPKQKSAILFGGDFEVKERVEDGLYKNGNVKYKTVLKTIHISGWGLPTSLTRPSKRDGYSTDAGVINEIHKKVKEPTVREYCKWQKMAMQMDKMCSTYLEAFLKFSINGILYPNYNTTQTETGRLSSSRPNLQNCPSSGDMLAPIQGQLIAPEGWVCVDIDYSSLEIYVLAMLSKDKALIHDLVTGTDLHCMRLSWIPRLSEGKSYEEIYRLAVIDKNPDWAFRRKKAKSISFKKAYGGRARSLAEAEELPVEEVQALFDNEDAVYTGVKEFNDRLFERIKDNQHLSREKHFSTSSRGGRRFEYGVELLPIYSGNETYYRQGEYRHFGVYVSPFGRRFVFEEFGQLDKTGRLHRRYSSTETKNYQVQGTGHDIIQIASGKLLDYVLQNKDTVRLVRQIHDSNGFYVKKGYEDLHIPKLCDIMSNVRQYIKEIFNYDTGIDFKVEAKVGANFAEMVEYEK